VSLRFKRIALVIAVVAAGVGFGVYLTNPRTGGSSDAGRSPTALLKTAAGGGAQQGNGLLKYTLSESEIRSFAVEQDLLVELKPSPDQSTLSQIHVRGQMDERLVRVQGRQLTYRYTFSQMSFESLGQQGQSALPASEAQRISAALNAGVVLLRTDPERSTLNWSINQSASPETLNLLRSIILAGSVFLPNADLSEWTGSEEDSTGVFTVSHRLVSLADGKAQILKEPRLLRIPPEAGMTGNDAQTAIILPDSTTKIDFDAKAGHLLKAEQRWALRVHAGGLVAITNMRTSLTFTGKREATKQDEVRVGSAQGQSSGEETYLSEYEMQAVHSTSLKKKVAAQKLGEENWESLRARFMSSDFHKDGEARAKFLEQLSALLYLQPELCTKVAAEISQLSKSDPDYKSKLSLLAGVFASQETPEAEAALVALAATMKNDSDAQMQILPAIGAHRKPSERTRDALIEAYTAGADEGVRSTAALALGTFASRARASRPELSREAIDKLKQDFDSTPSLDNKVTLSGALGNAGTREAMESVKVLFERSQDASMKRAAIFDLRFVDDDAADSFLEKTALDASTDRELVIQCLRVMRMRPPQKRHFKTAVELFRAQSSAPTMRTEALYTLSYLFPAAPQEVTELLEEATKDKNLQIAKQAEQLLARKPKTL